MGGLSLIFLGGVIDIINTHFMGEHPLATGDSYKLLAIAGYLGSCWALSVGFWKWLPAVSIPREDRPVPNAEEKESHVAYLRLQQQLHDELNRHQAAEQKLVKEKEYLQFTLRSIGDAMMTTDTHGTVLYMNPMAEALTGWSVRDAQGRALNEVFHIIRESDRTVVLDLMEQCLRKGRVAGLADQFILISRTGEEYAIQDAVTPIRGRNGEVLGMVLVFNDVTEARRIQRQMNHQATHDDLTGLVNRREFERRLSQALATAHAEHTEHAICYLDLDQFKVINDTCGHMAGDELLRQVAKLLRSKVRKLDTLARLGGDEFGVLMESCSIEHGNRVANTLREAVQNFRFIWEGKRFGIGVSIGLVPVNKTSDSVTGILKAADGACYTAKEKGRNRIHVVYRQDDTALVKRHGEMQWVFLIPWALEEERFQLNFQPIVPLQSSNNNSDHYELLIRLKENDGNIISPSTFLLPAERYNLAPKLDRWVIQAAFAWYVEHPQYLARLFLCEINLSGQSVGDEQFLQFIIKKFKEGQIPPEKICFEITETAAIANLDSATHFIGALKELGCRFALDDFGSGLSSFAYLRNLAVDFLKIDGLFVKNIVNDPIDLALVKSINDIGKVMGIKTIAEFVENEQILSTIKKVGIDYAQGYAVGRPQPLDAMPSRASWL